MLNSFSGHVKAVVSVCSIMVNASLRYAACYDLQVTHVLHTCKASPPCLIDFFYPEKTATLYGAFQLTAILYDDLIYTVKWAYKVIG